MSRHERGAEDIIATAFVVAAAAAIGLTVLYWMGGQPQIEGALLALAGLAGGTGLVTWAHRLLPQGPFTEPLEVLASTEEQREAFETDLDPGGAVSRRHLITRSLGLALAAWGAALVVPLRSLGPRPTDTELNSSPWAPGTRLVSSDGRPVKAADVPLGGLVSAFPEGATASPTGQIVLVRVEASLVRPGPRQAWSPEGLLAFSKICTHAGCPVGLYEADSHQLLCPCHQSTFDVLSGARPIFGPAATSLPQLPLAIDPVGNVIATGGFSSPPGPSFWNRHR